MFRSFWQNGHTSTVLDLCFDSARLRFCFSRSQLGMIRLCWKYVSTFLIKVGHFLTVLNLCFDIAWPLFRRSRPKMAIIWLCSIFIMFFSIYVLTAFDLFFDFIGQKWEHFDCARRMLRLLLKYVSIFFFKIGYVSTMIQVCFGFHDQKGHILTVLNLCFDILDLSFDCARPFFRLFRPKWAIFDCARPMFRLLSTYVSIFLIKI